MSSITIQDFQGILEHYESVYNETVDSLEKAKNAGWVDYKDYWRDLVQRNIYDLIKIRQAAEGDNFINTIKNGGVVPDELIPAMQETEDKLALLAQEIDNAWQNNMPEKLFSVAIIYWADTPIGKYIATASKYYLGEFKKAKDIIEKSKEEIKQWDNITDKTEREMEIYSKLKEIVARADPLISIIEGGVGVDNLNVLYRQFGIGEGISTAALIVIFAGIILTLAVLGHYGGLFNKDSEAARAAHSRIDERTKANTARIVADYSGKITAVEARTDLTVDEKSKLIDDLQAKRDAKITAEEKRGEEDKERVPSSGPDIGTVVLYGAGIVGGSLILINVLKYMSERQRTKTVETAVSPKLITQSNPGVRKDFTITSDELHNFWVSGKIITLGKVKYRVGRMSYGAYFLEPEGKIRGETEPFSGGTLWLEKFNKNLYRVEGYKR